MGNGPGDAQIGDFHVFYDLSLRVDPGEMVWVLTFRKHPRW
jgi:hypothetical protein